MILKWIDDSDATNFIDGIDHLALLGAYGLGEETPDYAAIYSVETVHWESPAPSPMPGVPTVEVWAIAHGHGGRSRVLHKFRSRSGWVWLLNDNGDTVERLI